MLETWNIIKKETLAQVFFWEFVKIAGWRSAIILKKKTFFLKNTSGGTFCRLTKAVAFEGLSQKKFVKLVNNSLDWFRIF